MTASALVLEPVDRRLPRHPGGPRHGSDRNTGLRGRPHLCLQFPDPFIMNGLGLRHPVGGFLNSLNTHLSPTCLRAPRTSATRHTKSAAVVMARVHHDVSSIHIAKVITTGLPEGGFDIEVVQVLPTSSERP